MKYLKNFKIFERKGDYQLFHKTSNLKEILKDGYIKGSIGYYDIEIRKNVIPSWIQGKYKTISTTRNLNYLNLPALELNVEKISDKYKIIPYSENPDYYLDFDSSKLTQHKSIYLTKFQNMVRSKSKDAGKVYWRYKTDKNEFDHGINEELILTDKLDINKYVKRIILNWNYDKDIIDLIKSKYPHIEIVEIPYDYKGYVNIKKYLNNIKNMVTY